jgi:hypothetical protein
MYLIHELQDSNSYIPIKLYHHLLNEVIFREKNGILRNDFLDCMMELRKRGKEDHQGTKFSVNNPTNDATFRKLTVV